MMYGHLETGPRASISVIGLSPEHLNSNPKKPTLYIQKGIWSLYLYLTSLCDHPPVVSSFPAIISNVIIQILNLTNIILDKWRHLYLYLEASSSLNISRYFFFYENEYPDPCKPTFRHKIRHIISISIRIRILILTSGSFFSSLQVVRYCFWCENWNPDPNKPIFGYTSRHIEVWPLPLYLTGL